MTFFVSTENRGQYFFHQPPIQEANLTLVVNVFKIVIQNRHIAQALVNGLSHNGNQHLRLFVGIGDLLPAPSSPAKSKTKQVLDLPQFVTGKRNSTPGPKQ